MKLRTILHLVRYELSYWILGGASMLDDAMFAWKNNLDDLPNKSGEVAVVTGGGRGIGLEVVKKLLQCNMHVILGCRNVKAGESAVKSIRQEGIVTGTAEVFKLDTSSMESVEDFVDDVLSSTDEVHLLVNNAGVMAIPYSLTADGFETQFSVNYLGHFLLTHLLLHTLKETGKNSGSCTRIVNVSSSAHVLGKINFDDINYKNTYYISNEVYAQSKLAQLMFSKALDRRLQAEGASVISLAVHPGIVNTDLFQGTALKQYIPWVPRLLFKSPEMGAISVVFAAVSDSLECYGGAYISNCRLIQCSSTANNEELQERLFKLSMQLLNIEEFGEISYKGRFAMSL